MENRTPAAGPTARPSHGWWAFATAVLVIAAFGAWWLAAPDAIPEPAPRMSPATAAAGALSTSGAARIVDAAPDPSAPVALSVPALAGTDPAAAAPAMPASPQAEQAAVADPFAAVVAAAGPAAPPRAEPARRPRATPAPALRRGEPDLLGTLLHNIESSRQTAAADAASLDELVRRLRGREVPQAQYRSEQVQSNLRDCPPANTVAGLSCRQEICAVYAGRDAACPALN